MNGHILTLSALCAVLLAGCGKTPAPAPDPDTDPDPIVSTLVKGADISWVTEMENKGYKFYNAAGQERECTALMKELGMGAIRLRVWVNPEGGWNGKADVVAKARRAQALGLKLLIDFHYSDTWADPGHQTVPAAWKGKDAAAMAAAVKEHTQDVLQALKAAGVDVAWVQVGNETTQGMLWESGKVSGQNPGEFVRYFHAGREAVKAVYPQAQVILHIDNGWKMSTLEWFLLKERYGKPVMLVEFGMPASQPDKAKAALQYLIDNTKQYNYFQGIFYWEPESEHGRNGYDYGAFSSGRPTVALDPFAN